MTERMTDKQTDTLLDEIERLRKENNRLVDALIGDQKRWSRAERAVLGMVESRRKDREIMQVVRDHLLAKTTFAGRDALIQFLSARLEAKDE